MLVKKYLVVLFVSFVATTTAFAAGKSRELSLDANFININGTSASLLNASVFMITQYDSFYY